MWYNSYSVDRSTQKSQPQNPQMPPITIDLKSLWDSIRQNPVQAIDFVITVIGFIVLWIQIVRTKRVATATKEATQQTIALMAERNTIFDIASISTSCREVQTALRGERYETALIRAQTVRNQLVRLRQRPGFLENDERLTHIQEMVAGLKRLQEALEKKVEEPDLQISSSSANRKLGDYMQQLSEWAEQFASRSEA